jgi:protein-S-isoprenylcysteine O-methyltransferase Ste14
MKTIRFIAGFLSVMAPVFFILILPTYVAGLLLSPPYDIIACAVILAISGAIIHFRDQIDARRAAWRARHDSHRIAGDGVYR